MPVEPPVISRLSAMVWDDMVPLSDNDREEVGRDAKQEQSRKKTPLQINS